MGWKAATIRPCTDRSRSRSPRVTVPTRSRVKSTERSACSQRLAEGKISAPPPSNTAAPRARRRWLRDRPQRRSMGLSVAEVSRIMAASRCLAGPVAGSVHPESESKPGASPVRVGHDQCLERLVLPGRMVRRWRVDVRVARCPPSAGQVSGSAPESGGGRPLDPSAHGGMTMTLENQRSRLQSVCLVLLDHGDGSDYPLYQL